MGRFTRRSRWRWAHSDWRAWRTCTRFWVPLLHRAHGYYTAPSSCGPSSPARQRSSSRSRWPASPCRRDSDRNLARDNRAIDDSRGHPRTPSPRGLHVTSEQRQLTRRFGLVSATALNMTNMIGVGPFITIPLLMSALGGPLAMLGWVVALVIVICDGMVWSELGAAMPGSGGSFHYLREAFGRARLGRLMAFLFV